MKLTTKHVKLLQEQIEFNGDSYMILAEKLGKNMGSLSKILRGKSTVPSPIALALYKSYHYDTAMSFLEQYISMADLSILDEHKDTMSYSLMEPEKNALLCAMSSRGLNQKDIAAAVETTPSYLSLILNGKRQLGTGLAIRMFAYFECDAQVDFLERFIPESIVMRMYSSLENVETLIQDGWNVLFSKHNRILKGIYNAACPEKKGKLLSELETVITKYKT
jgi:transcriptional regulator with XRE-family HTH domain